MPILADTVDGVIGVDPTVTPWRLPPSARSVGSSPRPRPGPTPPAISSSWSSPTPRPLRPGAALLGGRGRRQLRRRADRIAAHPRRAGRRGLPAQAPRPSSRRQDRCDRCGRCGSGDPWPPAPAAAAPPRRPRSPAGAADHPTPRHQRPGCRHQPAQGAHRRCSRGVAGRAARRGDQGADRPLCGVAGPAGQAAGAPHDRRCPADHRRAHPGLQAEIDQLTAALDPLSPPSRPGWSNCPALGRSPPPRSW